MLWAGTLGMLGLGTNFGEASQAFQGKKLAMNFPDFHTIVSQVKSATFIAVAGVRKSKRENRRGFGLLCHIPPAASLEVPRMWLAASISIASLQGYGLYCSLSGWLVLGSTSFSFCCEPLRIPAQATKHTYPTTGPTWPTPQKSQPPPHPKSPRGPTQ